MKVCYIAVLCVLGLAQADVADHFDCMSGTPMRSSVAASRSESPPFRLDVSNFADPVSPGGTLRVTIRADRPFSGFFLRAHYPTGTPIGQWQAQGSVALPGTCGSPSDVIHGVDGDFSEALHTTWVAPDEFLNHEIEFVATVVEPDGTFWDDVRSMIISTSQSDVPLVPQPAQLPAQPDADSPVAPPAAQEPDQTPHLDPRETAPVSLPNPDDEVAVMQPAPVDKGTGEDPQEPERLAREHHDDVLRHDAEGPTDHQDPPADQPEVDPALVHDSRREDEMEAAWQEKKAQMIDNEEANSEGAFNRVELLEREEHEKEIHEEQMAFEREQEEREKIRMERLRAEIRDKEEYDRQKADQQRRLEEERLRELELERERQLLEDKILAEDKKRENEAVKGKATAGVSPTSFSVAAILTVLTAMLL